MEEKNIFDSLEAEEMKQIGEVPSTVKENIDKTMGLIGLVGTIAELYSTAFFDCISDIIGSDSEFEEN